MYKVLPEVTWVTELDIESYGRSVSMIGILVRSEDYEPRPTHRESLKFELGYARQTLEIDNGDLRFSSGRRFVI